MNVNTPTVIPSTSCARTHWPKTRRAMRRTAQTSNRQAGRQAAVELVGQHDSGP